MIKDLIKTLYRPYIYGQYSLFLNSKNNCKEFPVKEIYGSLTEIGIHFPIWSEVTLLLILSNFINFPFGERIIVMVLLAAGNIIASRYITMKLKKDSYIQNEIKVIDKRGLSSTLYKNVFISFLIVASYFVIPTFPIIIYCSII